MNKEKHIMCHVQVPLLTELIMYILYSVHVYQLLMDLHIQMYILCINLKVSWPCTAPMPMCFSSLMVKAVD